MNISSQHGGDREPAGRAPPPGGWAEFTSVRGMVTSVGMVRMWAPLAAGEGGGVGLRDFY